MPGAYGGLIVILMYGTISMTPSGEGYFLLLEGSPFKLLNVSLVPPNLGLL